MGNTRSADFEQVDGDLWWSNDQPNDGPTGNASQTRMEQVRQELSTLHEKRRKLIAEKKKEFDDLRQELAQAKRENEQLKLRLGEGSSGVVLPMVDVSQQTDTFEVPGQSETKDLQTKLELDNVEAIKQKNRDLQISVAELQRELQGVNSEVAAFENERQEYKTHVIALKDIITVSKQLLLMRQGQIKELSQKVAEIQASLSETELAVLSNDLRGEYERQLNNIKQLRVLYDQRQQADQTQMEGLKIQLEESKNALKTEETKSR